jgi:two-component system cell cycle sensor histidine kinase/response regulator CckA
MEPSRPPSARLDPSSLLDGIEQALIATTLKGKITFWNRHAERLYGWAAEDVLGRDLLEVLPCDLRPDRGQEIMDALRAGHTHYGHYDFPRRDGTKVRVSVTVTPLTAPDGTNIGIVGTSVVAREDEPYPRADLANELLLKAWRASRDAVSLFRISDGMIVEVNDAWLRATRLTREKVIGHHRREIPLWQSAVDEDRFQREMAAHGFVRDFHFEFPRASGEAGYAVLSAESVEIGGEAYGLLVGQDVTETFLQARALEDSEQKYRSLFQNSLDGVILSTPDHQILAANPAAVRMFGWSEAELQQLGEQVIITTGEIRSTAPDLEESGRFRGHQRLRRRDGTTFIGEVTVGRFEDGSGAGRSTVVIRDVTDAVHAMEKLEAAESKFRTLVEHALVGVYIIQDGRHVYCNPALTRILGYDEATLLAFRSVLDIVIPEDRERVRALMNSRAAHLERDLRYSFGIQRSDGAVAEVEVHGAGILYEGRPAVVGTAIDVTEQRRSQDELRRSEERYRTLVEEAQDIIFTCDLEGRITSLNRAFEDITGWRAADWIGRNFTEILQPESIPDAAAHFREILADGPTSSRQSQMRAANGDTILIEGSARPLVVDGVVVGTLGITRDITERRRLEIALERSGRFTALGRLAATLAHEFNNVLMGIQSTTDVLHRTADLPAVHTSVTSIRGSVQRGRRITQDVLSFTRSPEPDRQPVSIDHLLTQLAPDFQVLAGPNIRVLVRAASDKSLTVAADRLQLEQAFINLILNARDAMPDGGSITIAVEQRPPRPVDSGPMVAITIEDTGTGMTSETVNLIFEPLFTTKKSGGTGLGLAIVHQIVERHHGVIEVHSEPGRGTLFEILLPLSGGVESPTVPRVVGKHQVRRLLLVEDDQTIAAGLAAVLELEGVAVEVVNLGLEAELAVETFQPDAVLLDLNLPDIDGREVYQRLSQRWPLLPVIISTGHGDVGTVKGFKTGGRTAFLLKPYDVETLFETLATVIASP